MPRLSSLRVRLALLVIAAVVPALLLVVFDFLAQRRETTAEAYGNALRVARAVAADQDQLIETTRQLLTAMALHPEVRSLEASKCSALAARLLSPIFANLGASTPDGDIFCSALPLTGRVNNADRAYFRRAMETRRFAVGEFQIGRITGVPTINTGYPLLDQSGRVRAVLFAAVDLREMSAPLAKTDLPAGSTVTVFDNNGTILARSPEAQHWVGRNAEESHIFKTVASGRGDGTAQTIGVDGRRRLYGYTTLPSPSGAGMIHVSVGIPVEIAFGPATRQLLKYEISFGIVALVVLVITWLTSNALILRPVRALVRAAHRLSAGELQARTGLLHESGELGQLAHAFDGMADSLQARQAEAILAAESLRQTTQTLQGIFEASPVAIVAIDTAARVTKWNPAAERIFGWTEEEALGRPLPWVGPEHQAESSEIIRQIQEGKTFSNLEVRRRKKDGSPIEISVSTAALRNDRGEIVGIVSLVADITARRQAEEARLAREAAEAANRAKSEFLSRMSHELRTPLNAILGFGQLLEMDASTPEQRESVKQILKAGRHLLNLINEILDIARIEAGRLSLSIEPVALQDVLAECLDLIRPAATQRRITLELPTPVDSLSVMADRQRLKQVLLNLLSNAVKFNVEGGRITIFWESRPQYRVRVNVLDTGPGIVPADLPRLFTPFERLAAGATGIEGTGLGLALSKTLMEAMEGTIGVESVVGQGSTFWIELPLAEKEAVQPQMRAPAPVSTPILDGARPPVTVLYIEDNLSNLKLLEHVMARRPEVRLLTAMQGRLGLDLARQHQPDLILLDLNLPDVGGDQILRILQDDLATAGIPVVILTATATPGEIKRLRSAGARAYLTKPFDLAALLKLIDEIVAEETRHA